MTCLAITPGLGLLDVQSCTLVPVPLVPVPLVPLVLIPLVPLVPLVPASQSDPNNHASLGFLPLAANSGTIPAACVCPSTFLAEDP